MAERVSAIIHVEGRVQGVGYRFFVESAAVEMGLFGYCRNLADGRVKVEVEGSEAAIRKLIDRLKEGPSLSQVTRVEVEWGQRQARFSEFRITH